MKKVILCIVFFPIFSCVTSSKIDANHKKLKLEMTLLSGEVVSESYIVSRNDSIYIIANNNKTWLVSKPNYCDDCIPTILKNNKVIVKDHKVIVKNDNVKVTRNKAIVRQY